MTFTEAAAQHVGHLGHARLLTVTNQQYKIWSTAADSVLSEQDYANGNLHVFCLSKKPISSTAEAPKTVLVYHRPGASSIDADVTPMELGPPIMLDLPESYGACYGGQTAASLVQKRVLERVLPFIKPGMIRAWRNCQMFS